MNPWHRQSLRPNPQQHQHQNPYSHSHSHSPSLPQAQAQPQWQHQWQPQWQPQWQANQPPRSSWQDPRLATRPSFYGANPALGPQPSPPPLATPHPVPPVYPMVQVHNHPSAPHVQNTSSWGVRYNHPPLHSPSITEHPGSSTRPPLPPRPTSIASANDTGHAAATSRPLAVPSQSWQHSPQQYLAGHRPDGEHSGGPQWPSPPATSQRSQHEQSPQSPASSALPPPPPPRPTPPLRLPTPQSSAHEPQPQSEQSLRSHHTPSSGASHTHSPSIQAQSHDRQQADQATHQLGQESAPYVSQTPPASSGQRSELDQGPPVSPDEAHTEVRIGSPAAHPANHYTGAQAGPSALGVGGPSDWEYLQGSGAEMENTGTQASSELEGQSVKPAKCDAYAELPANLSSTSSRRHPSFQSHVSRSESTSSVRPLGGSPPREQSVSPELSSDQWHRRGTIDGVIQVWNAPLSGNDLDSISQKSLASTVARSRHEAPESSKSSPMQASQLPSASHTEKKNGEPLSPVRMESEESIQLDPVTAEQSPSRRNSNQPHTSASTAGSRKAFEADPYGDLGPEYKASLARYVSMLRREEAAAEEEKHRIFQAFMSKETRLRKILYNVEDDDLKTQTLVDSVVNHNEDKGLTPEPLRTAAANGGPSTQAGANVASVPALGQSYSPKLAVDTKRAPYEDPEVAGEGENEEEYSPGGRPRIPRTIPSWAGSHPAPSLSTKLGSPSDYAPIALDDLPRSPAQLQSSVMQGLNFGPSTAPPAGTSSPSDLSIKFEPPRPAYTPFRYAQDPRRDSEPSDETRPAYEAYSALRHQGMGYGRMMAPSLSNVANSPKAGSITSPSGKIARQEHEEAFLGLIRDKSRAFRAEKPEPPSALSVNRRPSLDGPGRVTAEIDALRRVIPATMPQQRQPCRQIMQAKNVMAKYPNVYTWIRETVMSWNRENRSIRERQEEDRHRRQEASEKHIDTLFNEHEIGYSDIGPLEADFKLAEATKRYEEDVQELGFFTERVFTPVTERLNQESAQLHAQYIDAIDLVDLDADSGSPLIHGDGDRMSHSDAMDIVLALYEGLQTRHVKVADAHHERERRRKQLELSVLHTNGDTEAIKRLEQRFAAAERQQALHEAREKDARANSLMDIFDRATMRGLGDNQHFVDDVMAKLRSIDDLLKEKGDRTTELLQAGVPGLLEPIEELLDFVANDSKRLLSISNTAEDLLNQADYEVSVAEARVANASAESMEMLAAEKNKEDERIRAEIDTRMGSVSKGPTVGLSLLRSLMKRLHDDPQHQDRVQRALEAAKQRNAAKTPVG